MVWCVLGCECLIVVGFKITHQYKPCVGILWFPANEKPQINLGFHFEGGWQYLFEPINEWKSLKYKSHAVYHEYKIDIIISLLVKKYDRGSLLDCLKPHDIMIICMCDPQILASLRKPDSDLIRLQKFPGIVDMSERPVSCSINMVSSSVLFPQK